MRKLTITRAYNQVIQFKSSQTQFLIKISESFLPVLCRNISETTCIHIVEFSNKGKHIIDILLQPSELQIFFTQFLIKISESFLPVLCRNISETTCIHIVEFSNKGKHIIDILLQPSELQTETQ